MMTYEMRRDTIITTAWEIWTNNGLGLDADDRAETEKTVADAVNNEWHADLTDAQWLAATLQRLRAVDNA